MQCVRCNLEMERGSCHVGQTGLGFLFAGLALPHLFFKRPGGLKIDVISWSDEHVASYRCRKCKAVTLFPG